MIRNLFISILILLVLVGLEKASGLKWVPYSAGENIPENVIWIDDDHTKCVGRAKAASNKTLPAEIRIETGEAFVNSYKRLNIETSKHSEILTTSHDDNCKWKSYNKFYNDIDQNVVRAGTDIDGDLILVGRGVYSKGKNFISSIYMPRKRDTQRLSEFITRFLVFEYLSCEIKMKWVDFSANTLPGNVVFGGKSKNEYDMYVARVTQSNGNIFTGYVMPEINAGVFDATTTLEFELSSSEYFDQDEPFAPNDSEVIQVLVGEPDEYSWVQVHNKTIPDYAVKNGRKSMDFVYVARVGNVIRPMTQYEAMSKDFEPFDVLVKNV